MISRTMPSSTPSLGRKCVETPIRDARTARIPFITAGESPSLSKEVFSCAVVSQLAKLHQDQGNNARNAWPQHGCS